MILTVKSKNWIGALGTAIASAAILLTSCSSEETIPGLSGFQIGESNGTFIVTFTAPAISTDFGLTIPIPGLTGATVSLTPALQTAGSIFEFSVPLSALVSKANFFPESGLPDGQPLPDIVSGTLPRWDVTDIKNLPLSFYLSDQAFALFIPLEFGGASISLPWELSASIDDSKGNELGKIYLIPAGTNGTGSGLFILLPYLNTATADFETNG